MHLSICFTKQYFDFQAAQQAKKANHPLHVIVGAFLHDIGHLVGIERHMEKMSSHGLSGKKEGKTTTILFYLVVYVLIFKIKYVYDLISFYVFI